MFDVRGLSEALNLAARRSQAGTLVWGAALEKVFDAGHTPTPGELVFAAALVRQHVSDVGEFEQVSEQVSMVARWVFTHVKDPIVKEWLALEFGFDEGDQTSRHPNDHRPEKVRLVKP